MKRWIPILLSLALLAGCGAEQPESLPPEEEPPAAEVPAAGLTLEMEHSCYDPSVDSYTYFVRNDTEETVEFGSDYSLQRQTGGGWTDITLGVPDVFYAIGYELQPGGTMALTCSYTAPAKSSGTYRLVKPVGGQTLYAEFEIGDSAYTDDTPYGIPALEDLPENYDADTAAETDVVYTNSGVKNGGAVAEFLEKSGLGAPCQLRTVQDYGENTPMLIDVIYENGHYLWRMRQGGEVIQQRFSYIVTDGTDLYLSNGADWETAERYAGKELAWLVPMGTAGAAEVETVERMTADRKEASVIRYRVWSEDGVWDAALTDIPTAFSVGWQKSGEGSWGKTYDLGDWDGLETAIWGLEWQEDGKLLLVCETVDGGSSRLTFDPETEQFT